LRQMHPDRLVGQDDSCDQDNHSQYYLHSVDRGYRK
jgi:hypothetical protein